TLALSPDTKTDATDVRLAMTSSSGTLAPGKSKDFKFTYTVPASVPNGKYFLLGSVTSRAAELSDINNTAIGPSTTVQRPYVDLRPSKLTIKPGAHIGGKLTTNFQLTNVGTLAAKGNVKFTATLVASPNTATGTAFAPITQLIQLKPVTGKAESLIFTVPG